MVAKTRAPSACENRGQTNINNGPDKTVANAMENIVDPKSRRINGVVYGSQEPLNITPKGSVDRNGGGAVASMSGPGRYCANAANVTSDNDTAAVTGSSNFDVSN
eukprot:scaffold40966_cov17-Cyclotella_meneghiniana.AAC.1